MVFYLLTTDQKLWDCEGAAVAGYVMVDDKCQFFVNDAFSHKFMTIQDLAHHHLKCRVMPSYVIMSSW